MLKIRYFSCGKQWQKRQQKEKRKQERIKQKKRKSLKHKKQINEKVQKRSTITALKKCLKKKRINIKENKSKTRRKSRKKEFNKSCCRNKRKTSLKESENESCKRQKNKWNAKRKYCRRKKPSMGQGESLVKISPTTNGVGLDELHYLERFMRLNTYLIKINEGQERRFYMQERSTKRLELHVLDAGLDTFQEGNKELLTLTG